MAVTKGPLFSLDASGTIAKAAVFSKWKGRNYVRVHAIPHNPKSGLQTGMRAAMKFTTQAYAALSTTIKGHWLAAAAADNITALNAQVRASQRSIRNNLGCIHDPTDAAGTTPTAPATLTPVAATRSIVVGWTHPTVTPGNYTAMLYMSETTGFTPDVSNLVYVGAQATVSKTIPNLTTGTPYYFRLRETNTNGEMGALIAQATATPA